MRSDRALLVAAGGGIGDTLLAAGRRARAARRATHAVDALVLPAHRGVARARARDRPRVRLRVARALERRRIGAERYARGGRHLGDADDRGGAVSGRHPGARRSGPAAVLGALHASASSCAASCGDRTTHWTQILLDYARAIGCDHRRSRGREFVPTAPTTRDAAALLRVHDAARPVSPLLHPTRGLAAQRARWPTAGFVALARRARRRARRCRCW